MKATNHFTRTILTYLELRAESDTLFAESFAKENKNIDDCITYIFNEVQKSGCMGFADDEIYSIAVHYYDEDDIEVGKPMNGKIVVNHVVELTEEEKEQAKYQKRKVGILFHIFLKVGCLFVQIELFKYHMSHRHT